MKSITRTAFRHLILGCLLAALLSACATSGPTLVQVAKNRGGATYHVSDRDVLEFTDQWKVALQKHFDTDRAIRYGSATTEVTLAALAGSAASFNWSTSTASKLGAAAATVFGIGQIIDAKGQAQAYEQAFSAIQAAEASYYFHQLGMKFGSPGADGRVHVINDAASSSNIPSDAYTSDGETLYFRVTKILKVLNDVLANKIPDLQDLKDSQGDTSSSPKSPAKAGAPPAAEKPNGSGDIAPAPPKIGSATSTKSKTVRGTDVAPNPPPPRPAGTTSDTAQVPPKDPVVNGDDIAPPPPKKPVVTGH